MRKIISLVCILAFPLLASAAYDLEDNGLNYTITDADAKTVEVAGSTSTDITSATIPSSVTIEGNTYSVTSIGEKAFYLCTSLTSIEIPGSITSIGANAFYYCSGITSIEIPNSVTSIGANAFESCSGITSIKIPESVTSIGTYAFYKCSGITSIEIPESITSFETGVFQGCSGLTSFVIPTSVISIGESAFKNCTGLTSIEIPSSVTTIGKSVFNGCTGITSVTIPESITSISNETFANCTNLATVIIGNSVTSIGERAFYACTHLTDITIGLSVTNIYETAFMNCGTDDSVEKITITVNTESAPTCKASTFNNVGASKVTLIIPSTWDDSWKTATGWKAFASSSTLEQFYAVFIHMTDVYYATIYTEKAVTIPAGVTAYVATDLNSETSSLQCTAIEGGVIPKTTGVILNAEVGTYMFKETTSEGTAYTSVLSGTLENLTPVSGVTYYTLAKENDVVGFYKFVGSTISANRAYYMVSDNRSEAISYSFSFGNGETTGISTAPTTTTATNGAIYNLQGQRVNTPTSGGIYIQNGRKFIAK